MIPSVDPDHLVRLAEQETGRTLSQDEIDSLVLWHKGQGLAAIIHTEGWQAAMEMLDQYVESTKDQLMMLPPGDPNVPTAHAAASALVQLFRVFQEDIGRAVEATKNPPAILN